MTNQGGNSGGGGGSGGNTGLALIVGGLLVIVAVIAFFMLRNGAEPEVPTIPDEIDVNINLPEVPATPSPAN